MNAIQKFLTGTFQLDQTGKWKGLIEFLELKDNLKDNGSFISDSQVGLANRPNCHRNKTDNYL